MNCNFCQKECKNENSLRNHQRFCKLNPNRQEHPRGYKGKVGWSKGLTKDSDPRIAKMAEAVNRRISESPETVRKNWNHSEDTKSRLSNIKKELYISGWSGQCGRAKKYKYCSPIAGEVLLDGTWELLVARYLDHLQVKWERNIKRFSYQHSNGGQSTYCPDFYVNDWDSFIEVKGYETELDLIKWSQFDKKLLVWRKDKITQIESELAGVLGLPAKQIVRHLIEFGSGPTLSAN